MSFVYVVGPAGSGKSLIQEALIDAGISAFDEDAPGVGSAHNLETGQPVPMPPVHERSSEWFDAHIWKVLKSALDELKSKSATEAVVLFGNSLTEDEIQNYVDAVIYLYIDEATMLDRIAERDGGDNDYGKSDAEIELIKAKRTKLHQRFSETAIVVDAARPIEEVVAGVLKVVVSG